MVNKKLTDPKTTMNLSPRESEKAKIQKYAETSGRTVTALILMAFQFYQEQGGEEWMKRGRI